MPERYLLTSVLVSMVSFAVVAVLSWCGVRGREPAAAGRVEFHAETPSAAYKIIRQGAGKGRVVLCLSLHSHSTPLDDRLFLQYSPYTVSLVGLTGAFSESLNGGNFLWVLMQEGVVRKIIYAVPDSEFERIARKITGEEYARPPIDVSYRGSPVFIHTMRTLPEIAETVVLYIDGSFYSYVRADDVAHFLREKNISYDLVLSSPGFSNMTGDAE